jgi:UDP-glucose 4-epimerase
MHNILVVGGAGYIGSHTVRYLANAGFDCVIYDNLSEGHREAIKNFELIEGDLLDYEKLTQVFKNRKISGVIHFAAFALVGVSIKDPLTYYRNNVIGTHNLLTAILNAEVKNIVFSSTCAVYGNVKTVPIDESFFTEPCNPYGETKLAIEKMLKWCDIAHGIKYVCPRYFNAAGAMPDGSIGEDHKLETHLIPLIYRAILRNETVSVFGNDYPTRDGSCIRDYIHVCDLADAHTQALKYLLNGGNSMSVNLGTEYGASVFEIIKAAEQVSSKTVKYSVVERRAGDPPTLIANASLAKEKLGWNARRGLEEIMANAWQWHENHPNGYGG